MTTIPPLQVLVISMTLHHVFPLTNVLLLFILYFASTTKTSVVVYLVKLGKVKFDSYELRSYFQLFFV